MFASCRSEPDDEPPAAQHRRPGSAAPLLQQPLIADDGSPKHNGHQVQRKSTLHCSAKVSKDESLYSIDSDASTGGSERKNKMLNGPKHANLKR